jgi:hypothetical protein
MSGCNVRLGQIVLILVSLAATPISASAASIVIRTGVDAGGAVLVDGAVDPFWTISVQGGAFAAAEVSPASNICCLMETVGSLAKWITDPSVVGSNTGWGAGQPPGEPGAGPVALADRTFDLSSFDLATVSFSGVWRVADFRAGIYLNGVLVDPVTTDTSGGMSCNPCNWQIDQAFALGVGSALFLPGLNTLELRGSSVNSIFDGFWLDAAIQGELQDNSGAPVPEPTTIALLGGGLLGIVKRAHRRRQIRLS